MQESIAHMTVQSDDNLKSLSDVVANTLKIENEVKDLRGSIGTSVNWVPIARKCSSAVRQFGGSAVQRFGGSAAVGPNHSRTAETPPNHWAAWRFGGSAIRRLGRTTAEPPNPETPP